MTAETTVTLRVAIVDEPENPSRTGMDEAALYELADDIKTNGLHQAIVVRPTPGGRYVVIAGHRRLLAHRIASLDTIEAKVRDADASTEKKIRFGENAHRAALSPMEEAREIAQMFDEETWDLTKIAHALHRTTTWVEQRLDLLQMPEDLCELVHARTLPINIALKLAEISDTPHRQYLVRYALEGGASYNVVREWVGAYHCAKQADPLAEAPKPELPLPGQPITITMPCFTCGTAHDHTRLHIIRICADCHQQISRSSGG